MLYQTRHYFSGGPVPSSLAQLQQAPPGSLPSPDEELWIIAKPEEPVTGKTEDEAPGAGAMMTRLEGSEKEIPLPLKHTDVQARIDGYIATVEVTQQFHNPYDEKIEAVYVFPLPQNAAVNEFLMVIGERKIRGIIREREEAEAIYREARSQGYVASLLTQERPNIFTQSVANIEPGKQIDVNIKYFNTLACVDGWYEFVFPMVVGPRFNPPGFTAGVGAVGRGHQNGSGQKTTVSYLRPGERSGHDISLEARVDAGVTIEEIVSRSHVIAIRHESPEQAVVKLSPNDSIPNKDFVLRYRVAGERIKSNLMTCRDARGGFFTLMLYPPKDLDSLSRAPLELVFVLDCSGSMSGEPIRQAKRAVQRALRSMRPEDSFQIIRFSNNASQLGPKPLAATPENIRRGLDYLGSLNSSGGTMMIEGIQAALDFPHDPKRLRFVCFLTDGYIGNEAEIFNAVSRKLGDSRIFSFGVGSSVNRYLLEGLARRGRGAVAYAGLHDGASEIMDAFFERISHPALKDIAIDWGALPVKEVFPQTMPDLFVGRPVIVTGRFEEWNEGVIRVSGKTGSNEVTIEIPIEEEPATGVAALPSVWARRKIQHLMDRAARGEAEDLPKQVKQLALDYSLMSAYTAFVAVDASRRTEGEQGTTVPVPVPVPEGVKYKTTVDH